MDPHNNQLLKNKTAIWGLVSGAGAWLFCLLAVALYWNQLPPQIPFLYSLPWGESWLIGKETLIWILAGFGGVLIFNLLLARTFIRNDPLLQNYVIWGAAAVEFMLAVNLTKIIELVT